MNLDKVFSILDKYNIEYEHVICNKKVDINNAKQLSLVSSNSVGFSDCVLHNEEYKIVREDNLLVLPYGEKNLRDSLPKGNYIFTSLVRLSFVYILKELLLGPDFVLDLPKKKTGNNVTISLNTFIGDNVEIGDNVKISSGCVVNNSIIKNNVTIYSGVLVGNDGFGYIKERDNTLVEFPHIGRTIIEDNVSIHPNSCIDRGALSDTVLRKGCKIDNLVHIGHNTEIGENTLIASQSLVSGKSKVGKNCWISPGCMIIDGITIADDTFIGIGSVVTRSILNPGELWFGVPAKKRKNREDI